MKSIFFLAEQQLAQWQRQGKSKAEIETALAENAAQKTAISEPLPGTYQWAVSILHNEYNRIYYTRAPIRQLDDVLELPNENSAGEPMPEARDLAEMQMRWGAKALIAKAYELTAPKGEDFQFKSLQQNLKKLCKLCVAKNKLEWKLIAEGSRRVGFERTFPSAEDADTVLSLFNEVLFLAHGFGDGVKLTHHPDSPATLRAINHANQPCNEVLRVEESKRQREQNTRK